MDRKMDSILRILMEQFPPKSELMAKPSIRRVTIQKRMGGSIDEGPWCHRDHHSGCGRVITQGQLRMQKFTETF